MGQKITKPEKVRLACDIVKRREGSEAIKKLSKVAKVCELKDRAARLQPEEWRTLLKEFWMWRRLGIELLKHCIKKAG